MVQIEVLTDFVTNVGLFYNSFILSNQSGETPLKESIFLDCLEQKKLNRGRKPFWGKLAKKYGYKSGENLRWAFKNARKSMGILGKNQNLKHHNSPKIGIVDIETLPSIVYAWGLYDQNISIDQVISPTCVLSWAGKFLNESKMFSDVLTPKEARNRNAKRITQSIWNFLNKCDAVVGHNFVRFDNKLINSAFLLYDLPPLKFKIIDTLSIARQNFKFVSNKLKYINQKLGIRNKIENDGFSLWRRCSDGDLNALQTMLEYNEGDIFSTEELFYRIRPYVRNFNVGLYNTIEDNQCPVCGSTNLKQEGFYYTSAGKWESVRCQDCKCISRRKNNLLNKDKRKSLLVNSK